MDDGYEPQVIGGNQLPVCEMYQIYGVPKETMEANANLIAAAPELFAIVHDLIAYEDHDEDKVDGLAAWTMLIADARKAMAKANGKEGI
jgi:hypothetical protein